MNIYKEEKKQLEKNKQKILEVNNLVRETSGIYILHRSENGFKYAYVGQAKHLLTRLAQHLSGYQHIDLSIKKHKFYSEENKNGYLIDFVEYRESELDKAEQLFIKKYADMGYQLRNKTIGGQGVGKSGLENELRPRGYYDGKKQGYEECRKYVAILFDKYMTAAIKGESTKIKERKLLEFMEFINKEK